MKLVKYGKFGPWWPSIFDDEDWSLSTDWPELSTSKGLDIYETDEAVVVEAAVPGVPEDKVDVTVEGNVISIKAAHEEKEEEKKKKRTYKSSRQTSFNYSTSLPRMVDSSNAQAEVDNGVVKITVPKTEEEKPKRIEVKKKTK